MTDQDEKYNNANSNMKNRLVLENMFRIKEEDNFVDDKVIVSETTIIVDNVELLDQIMHDKIKQYQTSTIMDNIKVELSSSEVQNNISVNVKTEEGFNADDIKIEFDNGLLYCEHCQAYYEDFCIECGMLVHILNSNVLNNTVNGAREELPNNILEMQHLFGQFRIFALKVIPEGVTFGPFTGLNTSECPLKIKAGTFVVNKDKSQYLNWMQYVNHAENISEQNLLVFQSRDNLYYRSTRRIQEGDELLVYFGEEYENSLNHDVETDFIPTIKHIVKDAFACTFCCLGFSSKSYLVQHKTICPLDTAGEFSIEELMQCPACHIHLNQKEYFKHHVTHCCNRNVRTCVPSTPSNQTAEAKTRPRQKCKCEQCKYTTKYKGEVKNHVRQHCEMRPYNCEICNRRFKTKECLWLHVENKHIKVAGKKDQDRSITDYVNAHLEVEYISSRGQRKKHFKCSQCEVRTKYKPALKKHMKIKHFKEFDYSCGSCDYKAGEKSQIEIHIKTKHFSEFEFRCDCCEYRTYRKDHLDRHIKSKHLNEWNHKCELCDYKTNGKSKLECHIKTKHLRVFSYKCESCEYRTNCKSDLGKHIKSKHLTELDYKCDLCDYKTHRKECLESHTKGKHLKTFDYACHMCDYKTNIKSDLRRHTKAKHLKQFDYECASCQYRTNQKSDLRKHVSRKHPAGLFKS